MFIRESESEHKIAPKTEVEKKKKPARHVSLFWELGEMESSCRVQGQE